MTHATCFCSSNAANFAELQIQVCRLMTGGSQEAIACCVDQGLPVYEALLGAIRIVHLLLVCFFLLGTLLSWAVCRQESRGDYQ